MAEPWVPEDGRRRVALRDRCGVEPRRLGRIVLGNEPRHQMVFRSAPTAPLESDDQDVTQQNSFCNRPPRLCPGRLGPGTGLLHLESRKLFCLMYRIKVS